MKIKQSRSQPAGKGPADYFTGSVRIDPLFQAFAAMTPQNQPHEPRNTHNHK